MSNAFTWLSGVSFGGVVHCCLDARYDDASFLLITMVVLLTMAHTGRKT